MALKLTPELQRVDAQLRALNRKLVTAAKTFGKQSQQYGHLESLVLSIYTRPEQTRVNNQGILQVARNAANVRVSAMAEEQKVIDKATKQYNIREHKQRLLRDWASRQVGSDGQPLDPDKLLADLSQSRKRQIIQQEVKFYSTLQEAIDRARQIIYKKSRQTAQTRHVIERMKKESKGRWTDRDTLQSWLTELTSSLGAQGRKIASDFERQTGVKLS